MVTRPTRTGGVRRRRGWSSSAHGWLVVLAINGDPSLEAQEPFRCQCTTGQRPGRWGKGRAGAGFAKVRKGRGGAPSRRKTVTLPGEGTDDRSDVFGNSDSPRDQPRPPGPRHGVGSHPRPPALLAGAVRAFLHGHGDAPPHRDGGSG